MNEDHIAPQFYLVNRKLDEQQVAKAQRALSMTPVCCAVVTSVYDVELAVQLGAPLIVSARDTTEALAQALRHFAECGQPALIIGQAVFLEGHYGDGRIETLV